VGDNFYGELERAFDKFPSMDILLGVFNAEVGREDVFKSTIRNESLHEISKDNGVRVIDSTSRSLTVKTKCSHIVTFINVLGPLLMEKPTIRLAIFW
jgi:hypothetical protein